MFRPAVVSDTTDVDLGLPRDLDEALDGHSAEAPVIVEFEETLWLRDANEAFLDHVRPRFLAAFISQFVALVGPWPWTGRDTAPYRDWLRVLFVVIVAPWSLWTWRRHARELGPRHVNPALLRRLRQIGLERVRVGAFGFGFVVGPLLEAIDPRLRLASSARLGDAPRFWRAGRIAAVKASRRSPAEECLVVTSDPKIAKAAPPGCAVLVWRHAKARFEQGAMKPLMPFAYLKLVKRPKEHYFTRGVLGYDFMVVFLAYAIVSPAPVAATISLFLFLLAFFCAYEIGYFENDSLGSRYEDKPTVSREFALFGMNFSQTTAWICAILLAGAGSLVGAGATTTPFAVAGGWGEILLVWAVFVGVMGFTRVVFHYFNVIEPRGRIVPMLALQLVRVLGYGLIFATSAAGAFFCIAHGIARWVPYAVYRFGGNRKHMPAHLICLLLFATFCLGLVLAVGPAAVTWHMGVIMAYVLARAAPDMIKFAPHLRTMRKMRAEAQVASDQRATAESKAAPAHPAAPVEPVQGASLRAPTLGLARRPES